MRTYETNFRDDSFSNYIIGIYTNYIGNNYVSIDKNKNLYIKNRKLFNNIKNKYKNKNIRYIKFIIR